jgi:2',3'-cyclic-nucleotide 2'-phosphodiesterase (5'-nucleotidase family)
LIRSKAIGDGDVIVEKAFEKLRSTLKELKKESDIIVILGHLNREGIVKTLDHVEGYDLLIGGHNDVEFYHPRLVDGKVYVQNGNDGEKIGKVVFDIDKKGNKKFVSYELIKVLSNKYVRDEAIEKMIRELEE